MDFKKKAYSMYKQLPKPISKYFEKYFPAEIRLDKPVVPIPDKKPKTIGEFKWPLYKLYNLNRAFTNYLSTVKDIKSTLYSQSNMMFITGAQKNGKSWFIKYNLKQYENNPLIEPKPLIMHWDLVNLPLINFNTFIHGLESMIIESLATRYENNLTNKKTELITINDIFKVLFTRYHVDYVKYYLKKCLNGFINDEEHFIINDDARVIYFQIYEELFNKLSVDQEFLEQKLNDLISALTIQFNNNPVRASLRFLNCILVAMEMENRPPEYSKCYYRTGIETSDFLFDILNYVSGFHDTNHFVDLQENKKNTDHFIHPVLVIEGFDKLHPITGHEIKDKRITDYMDHLLLRTYVDTRYRTHFPIIIETNDSRFFNREICTQMRIQDDEGYAFIELYGFINNDQKMALDHIFNNVQIEELMYKIGNHIQDWHHCVNHILEDKKANFANCLTLQTPQFHKEKLIFQAKLNKLFTHPDLGAYLDDGTLQFRLLEFFEKLLSKDIEGIIYIGKPTGQILLELPIVKALLDCQILYLRKYFSYLHVQRVIYRQFIRDYIQQIKAKMTIQQKTAYKIHQRIHYTDLSDLKLKFLEHRPPYLEDAKFEFDYEISVYHPNKVLEPLNVMEVLMVMQRMMLAAASASASSSVTSTSSSSAVEAVEAVGIERGG